ncbi:MAG TPA: OmpA family protein [Chitinophagaceae bacterium]|nr:OmpA family protein [Chitinophagaceae bacterium]
MSFNLLEMVKGHFNSDLVNKAASYLGENESAVTKALSGIIPAVAGTVASKASSGTAGANEILNAAKDSHSSGIFSNLPGLLSNGDLLNKGAGILTQLFGDKANGIINTLAGFAGIKPSSASSLMSMAAPAAMSSVGKFAVENNLTADGLMNMMSSQKSSILSALPSGLSSLTGLLGLGKIGDAVSSFTGNAKNTANAAGTLVKEKSSSLKWLLPLLGIAAAALLAWWFLLGGKNGCNTDKAADKDTAATTITATDTTLKTVTVPAGSLDSVTGNFVYDLGKMITIDLPNNGGKLEVGENSTEAKLVAFLNDASKTIDTVKGNWFEFTNVRFKTGGSEITDESMSQLKNMVAIAKAYPSAQFKVGGYTDNTGKAEANLALSQKRADAVAAMLKKLGATDASIVGTKGYGQEWPIADNATAEGRAMNRRVAVNVKAK